MDNTSNKVKTWLESHHINRSKIKRLFVGKQDGGGLLTKVMLYGVMTGIAYVFIYPIIYMLSKSLMPIEDIINPMVKWLPTAVSTENYAMVLQAFNLREVMFDSFLIASLSTLTIVVSSGLIGFGLARYDFPFKKVMFALILVMFDSFLIASLSTLTIVVSSGLIGFGLARYDFPFKKVMFALILIMFALPPQIMSIPRYVMYNDMGLIGSIFSFLIPAFFGQGLNAAIFILIYYQFFRTIPKVLTEAAQIEGAGHFTVFRKIYVPLGGPAILTSTLYAFIWYWNNGALTTLYMGRNYTTVMMQLNALKNALAEEFPVDKVSGFSPLSEGVLFAGNMIALLPLLVLYVVLQRFFVESIDRAGITGE
jgi:multiple sugar transport system permease protein